MWAQKYKNPHIYATNPQEKECLCIKKSYKRLRKRKNMHFNLHHKPPKVVRVPQILLKKHSKVYLTTCNIYLTACNIYFTTRNIYFTSCNIVFTHCRKLYEANERLCKASAEDFGVRIRNRVPRSSSTNENRMLPPWEHPVAIYIIKCMASQPETYRLRLKKSRISVEHSSSNTPLRTSVRGCRACGA